MARPMTRTDRKRARKYISLRERLAAAYSMLLPQAQRDELRAARVPAKTVIALFTDDHGVLHALGGADKWWNLTPMLRAAHAEKSRCDTSIVAKVRRISAEYEDFRRRVLAVKKRARERPSRFPRGRKLQSRSLIGKQVCFAYQPKGPSHRVQSVGWNGMVTLADMVGEFAPHLFVKARRSEALKDQKGRLK